MITGESIVRSARNCIGARFRAQGRDPATGLDCVGLVAVACGGALIGAVPSDYAQRGGNVDRIVAAIERAGFWPITFERALPGDLLLLRAGPAQWHLVIRTEGGFVHADARLRRVTETPGPPDWPVAGAWRITEGRA